MGEIMNRLETLKTALGANDKELLVSKLEGYHLDHYWPQIAEQLRLVPHIWDDSWTLEALYTQAISGSIQLWGVGPRELFKLVVFTQVGLQPKGEFVLQIFLMIGHGMTKDMLELMEATFEHFARMMHCTSIEVIGRDGWLKVLAGRYEDSSVRFVMSRKLDKERLH